MRYPDKQKFYSKHKEELRKAYFDIGLSYREIAQKLNTHHVEVGYFIVKFFGRPDRRKAHRRLWLRRKIRRQKYVRRRIMEDPNFETKLKNKSKELDNKIKNLQKQIKDCKKDKAKVDKLLKDIKEVNLEDDKKRATSI